MDCKKAQELLLTDYVDGEVSATVSSEIKAHLKSCTACRALEQKVLGVRKHFREINPVQPPEKVWNSIKESLAKEQVRYEGSLVSRAIDFIHSSLWLRKPAFALSTVITVILLAVTVMQFQAPRQRLVKDYLRQQSDYMRSLQYPVNGETEKDFDFGTNIESYLF
jgi:predicted anti-sigma-YlaC factor YlaD